MQLLLVHYWPLAVALLVFIACAACNHCTLRLPNSLTYPAAVAGWICAAALPGVLPIGGSIGSSILCTVVALALSLPAYGLWSFPAGCVKAQAAAAAWIGCGLPLLPALAITAAATLGGIATTGLTFWFVSKWGKRDSSDKLRLMDAQMPMTLAGCGTIVAALALGWL
jgi:hypothetical protein